jgi:hypothetical protein
MTDDDATSDPIELPVDGTLDLHTFSPREIKDLIPDYLASCRERGIDQVRIVHGKGTGVLRRTVQALLGRLPEVKEFHTAGPDGGGWGATIVILHPGVPRRETGSETEAGGEAAAARAGKENAMPRLLRLELLAERLTICRLAPDAELPAGLGGKGRFVSITRTRDELSVVCAEEDAPPGARCSGGWRGLRVEGTLDFGETGLLLSLAAPLAEAGIAIFVVSTHDTDYLLVKDDRLDAAQRCLRAAGHLVDGA